MKNNKNSPPNNGINIFSFLHKSYDETMSLIKVTHDYFLQNGKTDREKLSYDDGVAYMLAMSTITTQLTSALGWLLMCRAVQNGEVGMEKLQSEEFHMPDFNEELSDSSPYFANLQEPVRSIFQNSTRLYSRIKRIEKSIRKT